MTTTVGNQWFLKREGQFSVLSDSREQAISLSRNMRYAQQWTCKRWGFPLTNLSLECRVFSASSQAILASEFRIDTPRVEMRKDEAGKDIYAIYMVADDRPADAAMFFLGDIVLKDMERQYNVRFGHWVYRGVGTLNCSYAKIQQKMSPLANRFFKDEPLFFSKSIMTMTDEEWAKQPADIQVLYDGAASAMCLMLFKEFGHTKFVEFIGSSTEQNLNRVFGISSYDVLDVRFKRYMRQLLSSANRKDIQIP